MAHNLLRRTWRKAKRLMRPNLHRSEISVPYRVIGSDYGGWPVITGTLDADSCVYSFGVGQDITFDLGLIEAFACRIEAFDPTPRCREWIETQNLPALLRFHPIGLADRTTVLRFFAPDNDDHVSFTVSEGRTGNSMVELPVRALCEIAEDLGDSRIDLLKMDIEGAEYDVVPDLLRRGPMPAQLCIEFHHRMFGYSDAQTRQAVAQLREAGYQLFYVSDIGHEYGFVHKDLQK